MGDLARSCGSSSSAAKCVPLLQFSRLEKEVDAASAQCVRTTQPYINVTCAPRSQRSGTPCDNHLIYCHLQYSHGSSSLEARVRCVICVCARERVCDVRCVRAQACTYDHVNVVSPTLTPTLYFSPIFQNLLPSLTGQHYSATRLPQTMHEPLLYIYTHPCSDAKAVSTPVFFYFGWP